MAFNRTQALQAAKQHLDAHSHAIDELQKNVVAQLDPGDAAGRAKLDASFANLKAKHAEFSDDCCVIIGSIEHPTGR